MYCEPPPDTMSARAFNAPVYRQQIAYVCVGRRVVVFSMAQLNVFVCRDRVSFVVTGPAANCGARASKRSHHRRQQRQWSQRRRPHRRRQQRPRGQKHPPRPQRPQQRRRWSLQTSWRTWRTLGPGRRQPRPAAVPRGAPSRSGRARSLGPRSVTLARGTFVFNARTGLMHCRVVQLVCDSAPHAVCQRH